MLIWFSSFAGKECLNIISRKEFKESEKKQVITIKVNGEVDDRVVVWGKLYDSGKYQVYRKFVICTRPLFVPALLVTIFNLPSEIGL